jgi:DNA-binding PadR family transcriptional regulator
MALRSLYFITTIDEMAAQLGTTELMALLAVLRLRDDAYGVPIAREISSHTGKDVLLGSIYAALARLEQKGLVVSRLGEPAAERGGRARRYFRVTAAGRREAVQLRGAVLSLSQGVLGAPA